MRGIAFCALLMAMVFLGGCGSGISISQSQKNNEEKATQTKPAEHDKKLKMPEVKPEPAGAAEEATQSSGARSGIKKGDAAKSAMVNAASGGGVPASPSRGMVEIAQIHEGMKGKSIQTRGYVRQITKGNAGHLFFTYLDANGGKVVKGVLFAEEKTADMERRLYDAAANGKLAYVDGHVDVYNGELEVIVHNVH